MTSQAIVFLSNPCSNALLDFVNKNGRNIIKAKNNRNVVMKNGDNDCTIAPSAGGNAQKNAARIK